jgi:hypothetical protein
MIPTVRMPVLILATILAACSAATYSSEPQMAPAMVPNTSEMELRTAMRGLWSDHVVYTRNYIISAVAGDASLQAVTDRLMKNQEDIGNAVAKYYGGAAGMKLTALLKDHIKIAGEVVAAAKANDNTKLKDADHRWHQNAEDIATFLSGANSNWSKDALVGMLNEHLALTTQEATARLQGKWMEDIATFDKVYMQAMMMADALSEGILKQFPAHT